MKKLLTAALLITGSALSYGQMYNPYVNTSSINPSPLQPAEENGMGTLTFHVGNSGSLDLTVPATSPMYINLSLSKGTPVDISNPTASISGTYASKFSWAYLSAINAFQGTQIQPLPAGGDGTIVIAYKVTQNSSISLPQNGFNVNVVPPAYSNGSNTTTDDAVNKYVYTVTVISGTVFNDVNGLTDLVINGAGTNAGGTLNAVLISSGNVVAVVAVAADGTYAFPEVPNGAYDVMITTANPTVGGAAPAASVLPTNWVNTGEGVLPVGDGSINGMTSIVKPANSVTGVNFGIEERPTALSSTTGTFTNPGAANTVTVPPASFTFSDPSGGTVTGIIITGLPTNATGININGILYNLANNLPLGGVTVPVVGGLPTLPILIDPIDGGVVVTVPFKAIDNATYQSNNTGTVTIPFGVPLPLDLLTFDAHKQGKAGILNWETANESKVRSFEIERGVNGSTFSYLGTVTATNGVKNTYSFTDAKPNNGANFYRLKMVDMDGKFTYSTVKQLDFTDTKMDLVLYPNPTANELSIEFKSGNCGDVSHASVSVFDLSGRMVISKPWEEVCKNPVKVISLSQLADGAYFINVRNTDNDDVILNKKIIKAK